MKVVVGLILIAVILQCQASKTARPFCLEELKRIHIDDSASVSREYEHTGEHSCFALKTHVSKCMDRSLLQLIHTIHPETKNNHSKPPSVDLETLEKTLSHYLKVDGSSSIKDLLARCAHSDPAGGPHQQIVTVGDFSKRCDCDFGDKSHCLAYEHVRTVFNCGAVEDYVPLQ